MTTPTPKQVRQAIEQIEAGLEILRASLTVKSEPIRKPQTRQPMPPRDVLAEQYWGQRLTLKQIAQQHNTVPSVVCRWLQAYEIARRPAQRGRPKVA